jgi:hypothetical protein
VADGQALDPVAEPEVVDQVDVQPGAAVAGAGDGQQVADLGGRPRPGPVQAGANSRIRSAVLRGRAYQVGSTTEARRSTPEAANTSAQAGSQPGWRAKNPSTISDCLNT